MKTLNEDFLDFIRLLEKNSVEYLIVGGYAVAYYGFPRYTGDMDFFVSISKKNAKRLMKTFDEFGFGDIGITKEDFLKPPFVIEIGREPIKIQVLTEIDGVDFEACFDNKEVYLYEGLPLNFIGLDDLITNKLSSSRPKDILDANELKKQKPS